MLTQNPFADLPRASQNVDRRHHRRALTKAELLCGDFELSGSIGQPDTSVMTGGDFELAGGFWFGLPPTDCNDDGIVSLLDHETFAACLSGPDGGIDASPCPCFDVDRDGDITLNDYAQLQAGFTGQ